jgi:hypothetical protein
MELKKTIEEQEEELQRLRQRKSDDVRLSRT